MTGSRAFYWVKFSLINLRKLFICFHMHSYTRSEKLIDSTEQKVQILLKLEELTSTWNRLLCKFIQHIFPTWIFKLNFFTSFLIIVTVKIIEWFLGKSNTSNVHKRKGLVFSNSNLLHLVVSFCICILPNADSENAIFSFCLK